MSKIKKQPLQKYIHVSPGDLSLEEHFGSHWIIW